MSRVKSVLSVIGVLVAGQALAVAVGVAGAAGAAGAVYEPRADSVASTPAPREHDPGKPTAVLVASGGGANVADLLAPYEVLAATGAFNLYTAAADTRPITLTGGLDLVPDITFDQLDQRLPTGPDVVIVPAVPDAGEPTAQPLLAWLQRQHADGGTLLMSVCRGADVLASAGLLDGRDATSHWLGVGTLTKHFPNVNWQQGVRYVDDGDVITTAGVLSGVDGALRIVERLTDTDTAARAAQAVGWRGYTPGAPVTIPTPSLARTDLVAALNAAYRSSPTTGVLLTDGVGETELASIFRPYTEMSYLARTVAVTADGEPIRSRNGLTFIPRAALTSAAGLDRLLVPGADAARRADPDIAEQARGIGLTPEYLHIQPGFPFDAALRDIAHTADVPTAQWVAKTLEYPTAGLNLTGPGWPWWLLLAPALLTFAGSSVALGALLLIRRHRRNNAPGPVWNFIRHYLEMLAAMLIGMIALGPLWNLLMPGIAVRGDVHALVMAADMTIGMALWMLIRRHRWPAIAEMSAAMVLPFVVLLVPYWTGTISAAALSNLGHMLMLPAMALAMYHRRDDYTRPHSKPPAITTDVESPAPVLTTAGA